LDEEKVMSEYINIISQEAITAVPTWLAAIGGIISIGAVLSTLVYWAIIKDVDKVPKYFNIVGTSALVFAVGWLIITSTFFDEPTGRYKYEATINKEKITVAQYEEFIEEYNPTIKGNIYYFEGGSLDE
jgi:hypothetical protein